MKKHFHPLGDWRRNVLLVAAAGSLGLGGLSMCATERGGPGQSEADAGWSGQTYSQGVVTDMTEMQPGEWKITGERPAGPEEVAAVLHHFGGQVDTLQGQDLQRQMQDYSQVNPDRNVQGFGLMDVLMWSGIGFMAGRYQAPYPACYASPGLFEQNQAWRTTIARERRDENRGFFGHGFSGGRTSATAGIRACRAVRRTSSRHSFRSSAPVGRHSAPTGRHSSFGGRGSAHGFGG
ncbi:hypothetical protein ACFQ48_05000 [Hymenobacter caeli]|uniref:UPF0323 domain-containing protein n=1 Tax=Hymenobacter caeli TaxID=2735894 RepID=A0ABX2FS78_9BACT|nr:hypothetical protein [Hymenobacter caeli]NRT19314.1 hypothetical protein [Hymenobacter caeli]